MRSIYEEIGGAAAVEAAVDGFYGRVLADPLLAPCFQRVDLRSLLLHQRASLAAALGGSQVYVGRSMRGAHLGLTVTPQAFDRVVEHLVATLTELEVAPEAIEAIAGKLLPLRAKIAAPPEELGAVLRSEGQRAVAAQAALAATERLLDEAEAAAAVRARRRWYPWRRVAEAATPVAAGSG